jgi:DNA-binding MarR family transcriptional regulator
MTEFLRDYHITPTQYNVLRILRGAGKHGLTRNEVRDRLVSEVPDASRLLNRMEGAGLIARERSSADRRMVQTTITKVGLKLLKRLDEPVKAMEIRLAGRLGRRKLGQLVALLGELRGGP